MSRLAGPNEAVDIHCQISQTHSVTAKSVCEVALQVLTVAGVALVNPVVIVIASGGLMLGLVLLLLDVWGAQPAWTGSQA